MEDDDNLIQNATVGVVNEIAVNDTEGYQNPLVD